MFEALADLDVVLAEVCGGRPSKVPTADRPHVLRHGGTRYVNVGVQQGPLHLSGAADDALPLPVA